MRDLNIGDIEKAVVMIRQRPVPDRFVFKLTLPGKTILIKTSPEEAYAILKKAWEKNEH